MNILSINSGTNYNTFRAYIPPNAKSCAQKFVNAVPSSSVEASLDIASQHAVQKLGQTAAIAAGVVTALNADKLLKAAGITYCDANGHNIRIAAGQHGFFTLNTYSKFSNQEAKEHILMGIKSRRSAFGGLMNYVNCVNDLKRQDIIMQGLRIHTYDLNKDVSGEDKEQARINLEKAVDMNIYAPDLFFIDDEAFYYDKKSKTVYGINYKVQYAEKVKPVIITCKFLADDKNNLIGFRRREWDNYYHDYVEKEYTEQQQPDFELPDLIDYNNIRSMAEAFRFGNVKMENCYRARKIAPEILQDLSKKLKNSTLTRDNLQIVRYKRNDKNEIMRICYYNADTGRSLVYDDEAEYLGQLEYMKDSGGNYISYASL